MLVSPWPFNAWPPAGRSPCAGPTPEAPSGALSLSTPIPIDPQLLRVAFAYDVLPFEVLQRFRCALAGEHNIAQVLETAREVVKVLSTEDLCFVLARLLVCTRDAVD